MNLSNSIIKENDEDLLSDTHMESQDDQQLNLRIHSLQQETESLQLAKHLSKKEAHKFINQQFYKELITLNEKNTQLRLIYQQMMKDRQLKKQNYYRQQSEANSLRSSGTFSLTSASKIDHSMTPKHSLQNKNITCQYLKERKSFCPPTRKEMSLRQSFDSSKFLMKDSQQKMQSDNIFLNLFALIVEEQKQTESELHYRINSQKIEMNVGIKNGQYLSEMETQVDEITIKVEKMMQLMKMYQDKLGKSTKQCDDLQKIIQGFSEARSRLQNINLKIHEIPKVKEQIKQRQDYIKGNVKQKTFQFQNLDLLLSMFDYKEGSELERVRQLGKQSHKLVIDSKQSKIRQLMESVKAGRQKFKQIYNIYMARIQALEKKLQLLK